MKYPFLKPFRAVFRKSASSYVIRMVSFRMNVKNNFNVNRSRKHWKCKYYTLKDI